MKKKRILLAAAIGAGLLFQTAGGWSGSMADRAFAAAAGALASPLAVLAERFPGMRGADLVQSKSKYAPRVADGPAHKPEERVLSTVRDRPAPPPAIGPINEAPGTVAPAAAPGITPAADTPTPPGGPPVPLPIPPIGGGGGGGGFVPTPPVNPPVNPPVTPPSAVPEPSTWLMMISGVALIGFALRKDRRRQSDRTRRPVPQA